MSVVPSVPEFDIHDYMGTQVRIKQNEEKGCSTSRTWVIILERSRIFCEEVIFTELAESGISGSWRVAIFHAMHVYGYPFQM